jgi:Lon protease-like protein
MPAVTNYPSIDTLPRALPIFPLPGALLLPRTQLPLVIFEPRYLRMVEDVVSDHRLIGMMQPVNEPAAANASPEIYGIGCAGRITSFAETQDDRILITLTGVARFRVLEELKVRTPYRQVAADYDEFASDLETGIGQDEVDRNLLLKTFRAYLEANNLMTDWDQIMSATNEQLVNSLAALSPFAVAEKQALLEAPDLKSRSELLIALTEMSLSATDALAGRQLQ